MNPSQVRIYIYIYTPPPHKKKNNNQEDSDTAIPLRHAVSYRDLPTYTATKAARVHSSPHLLHGTAVRHPLSTNTSHHHTHTPTPPGKRNSGTLIYAPKTKTNEKKAKKTKTHTKLPNIIIIIIERHVEKGRDVPFILFFLFSCAGLQQRPHHPPPLSIYQKGTNKQKEATQNKVVTVYTSRKKRTE